MPHLISCVDCVQSHERDRRGNVSWRATRSAGREQRYQFQKKGLAMKFRFLCLAGLMLAALAEHVQAGVLLGAKLEWTGTGASSGVDGFIYDKDIHSGVFRLANGTSSDSYVLQGGDPFGGDTGDDFEVTQSDGHASVGGFDITTHYDFGTPFPQLGTFIDANPDTGSVFFKNSTGSTWTGVLTLSGLSQAGPYFSNSASLILADGAGGNILLNEESSNYGGYNPTAAVPEPSSLAMLGIGAIGVAVARRKRKQQTLAA